LNRPRIMVTSGEIMGPVGQGLDKTLPAIRKFTRAIKQLYLFPTVRLPSLAGGFMRSLPLATGRLCTCTRALTARVVRPC